VAKQSAAKTEENGESGGGIIMAENEMAMSEMNEK
jgi:hypothetical protein